jgi:hypothetical protein
VIPVRVPADFVASRMGSAIPVAADHLLIRHGMLCPACDRPFDTVQAVVLVPVGIPPYARQDAGWTTAGAVPVHAECARPLTPQEAADELSRMGPHPTLER